MEVQRLIPLPAVFKITTSLFETLQEVIEKEFPTIYRILLVSDPGGAREYGERLKELPYVYYTMFIKGGTIEDVMKVEKVIRDKRIDVAIGVGGGRILDTVKLATSRTFIPSILVPTALSHDGIISPVAVIDFGNEIRSTRAIAPYGAVVDINIISRAPRSLNLAGCGDLISNISALEDWKLASKIKGERIDYFAYLLSRQGARSILYSEHVPFSAGFLEDLAEGLAASGISMIISGNSRPASGAEHLISHALDKILKVSHPHGIQVGIATLFTQKLRGQSVKRIKEFYKKIGFPLSPMEIGISKETFMEAVRLAPTTRRGRFTILDIKNKPYDWEKAFEVYLE